jgi:hypothetical protein
MDNTHDDSFLQLHLDDNGGQILQQAAGLYE